jgi:hypothetical protein
VVSYHSAEAALGPRVHHPVDGGEHQVGADRDLAVAALRAVLVDDADQTELVGELPEGGDRPEAAGANRLGGAELALLAGDHVLKLAEVDLLDQAGLAVHPAGADGVVVGVPVDDLGDQPHL